MMPIYRTLETKFGCQGFCKPSLLWMSKPINEGPPVTSCGLAANAAVVNAFGGWGAWLLIISLAVSNVLTWSCCLYRRKLKFSPGGVTVLDEPIDHEDDK